MADTGIGAKIDPEDIERARRQIGVPQYERNPVFNRLATEDTISHFAFGIGDDNPLWHDPDYAADTRWRGVIGSPLYATTVGIDETPKPTAELKDLFRGLFRGVGKYYSGASWEWFRPICPGDRIYREYTTYDVQVKENSEFADGGITVIDTYRYLYVNHFGEPVATHDMSFINAERSASKKAVERKKLERQTYTPDDIARIDALYAAEERRGAALRYWEDVQVGDVLPPVVKGPLTIRDVVGFHIGWGFGQTYGAGPLRYGWKQRQRMPAFYTLDEYGVPDVVQRLHWEQGRAMELGQPAPYDYGTMRTNWLGHLITNWMGDDAWLWKLRTEMRGFNYVGDTSICSGEVVAKRQEGLNSVVDIKLKVTNQHEKVTTPGTATVVLPTRAQGAVSLPRAPDPVIVRSANMVAESAARRRGASG
jgi:acyl dehydratase